MELTFLAVAAPGDNPYSRIAHIISFVLDPGNTVTTLGDVCGEQISFRRGANDCVIITSDNFDYMILSAGLIISARSGNSYVYTNSKMCASYIATEELSGNEDAVISSYMGGSTSRSSDLILQQASNKAPGNRVIPSSISQVDIELAEGVTGDLSSSKAGIVTMTNGDKRILVANALGQICDYADGIATPVTITPAGGSASPLTMADTTFDGNGTITIADVQLGGLNIKVQSGGDTPEENGVAMVLPSLPVSDGYAIVVKLKQAATDEELEQHLKIYNNDTPFVFSGSSTMSWSLNGTQLSLARSEEARDEIAFGLTVGSSTAVTQITWE